MQTKRNWTPEEKMQIVLEGMRGDATVAEVCRRHGISATLYYEWKDKVMNSAGEIFKHGNGKPDHEKEKMQARLNRLESVIAEITSENLEMKKRLGR